MIMKLGEAKPNGFIRSSWIISLTDKFSVWVWRDSKSYASAHEDV